MLLPLYGRGKLDFNKEMWKNTIGTVSKESQRLREFGAQMYPEEKETPCHSKRK